MSADGPEAREAAQLDRELQGCDDLQLAEQLADEARDVEALTAPELNVAKQIDKLGASALAIKQQRDDLAAVLRDIAMGADMMLQPAMQLTGAIRGYVMEVKRVARAGLHEAGQ